EPSGPATSLLAQMALPQHSINSLSLSFALSAIYRVCIYPIVVLRRSYKELKDLRTDDVYRRPILSSLTLLLMDALLHPGRRWQSLLGISVDLSAPGRKMRFDAASQVGRAAESRAHES